MPDLNRKCPPYPAVFAPDQVFAEIRSTLANETSLSVRVTQAMRSEIGYKTTSGWFPDQPDQINEISLSLETFQGIRGLTQSVFRCLPGRLGMLKLLNRDGVTINQIFIAIVVLRRQIEIVGPLSDGGSLFNFLVVDPWSF